MFTLFFVHQIKKFLTSTNSFGTVTISDLGLNPDLHPAINNTCEFGSAAPSVEYGNLPPLFGRAKGLSADVIWEMP